MSRHYAAVVMLRFSLFCGVFKPTPVYRYSDLRNKPVESQIAENKEMILTRVLIGCRRSRSVIE